MNACLRRSRKKKKLLQDMSPLMHIFKFYLQSIMLWFSLILIPLIPQRQPYRELKETKIQATQK